MPSRRKPKQKNTNVPKKVASSKKQPPSVTRTRKTNKKQAQESNTNPILNLHDMNNENTQSNRELSSNLEPYETSLSNEDTQYSNREEYINDFSDNKQDENSSIKFNQTDEHNLIDESQQLLQYTPRLSNSRTSIGNNLINNQHINQMLSITQSNTILPTEQSTPMRNNERNLKQYAISSNNQNTFIDIANLTQQMLRFRIRCKIIHKSPIKYFDGDKKVFDAIVTDNTGEIKLVAFNEQVNLFYQTLNLNESVLVQNGQVRLANNRYRTAHSVYEIRLSTLTTIQQYTEPNFNPTFIIYKQNLNNINNMLDGSSVDIEALVISDYGVTTSLQNNLQTLRRRTLKIMDDTATIYAYIWNNKIDDISTDITDKQIRIRNAKVNHYNGTVSINLSEQSIIEVY